MTKKVIRLLFVLCMVCTYGMNAQTTVKGVVVDSATKVALPGVSIVIKGTSNGTTTDFDGNYSINVPNNETALEFSYIGFVSQVAQVNGRGTINISLIEDISKLDEVVVTALGIKRDRKSLGYSVQELKGQSLTEARETNVANALSGKISGLQVIKGSNGPASSSKIVLRGNSSLTGDNQPLIVVDGVPMDNFTGADNNDFFNPSQDLGNGLGDLNPDDIETMTVLKGASAAALYGSRAGNGVILITTKTGKSRKGLGITFSVTTGFERLFLEPETQRSFGQGSEGVFRNDSRTSWGPKIAGQEVVDFNGNTTRLSSHDNIGNFYTGGFNQTYSLSFQQQVSDATSLYSSVNYLKDDSNIPGATLQRLNLMTRAVSKFGENKKWTSDVKVQYINMEAGNRPLNGSNVNNAFGTIAQMPASIDVNEYRDASDEFGKMRWFVAENSENPYWSAKNRLSTDTRDRFLLNGSLKYQVNDWLSSEVKAGADLYDTTNEAKLYSGSPGNNTGRYSFGKDSFIETNYSFLLLANKDDVVGKFGTAATLGGNLMARKSNYLNGSSGDLVVPNLFSLNNGVNSPSIGQGSSERRTNSIYGTFQINYDGYAFLDFTGRNDWSSTLSEENRSFFYPSISASFVVTDMLTKQGAELPAWLSFGKLRASYATVGNDLNPYQLYNYYSIGNDANNNTTAGSNKTLFNPEVKSELIKSKELGLEVRFFQNRLGLDFAWYQSNATNQLIDLPLDPLSGYNFKKVNAGDVQNKGVELSIIGKVIHNPKGFNWESSLNYSHNRNTIESLADDVTQFRLGGFDNLAVLAVERGGYGEIWGTRYSRVEDKTSPNFGKIIVDGNGLPIASSEKFKLGSQQPDAMLGFSNTFTYKNFSFGFLIDARFGGEIFSGSNHALQESGNAAVTVVNGERNDLIVDGVVSNGTGGFTANTLPVSAQRYWEAITARTGNLGINEANIYDATNIRLRNINVNFAMPKDWLGATGIQSAKIGLSANNVWMIKNSLNGIDPESVFATGTNATGFEYLSSPTTSSVFFNVSLSF
ncbi:SusC/RagA family TonB-linked outer membrane protein [Flavobacterium hiemivividum]|uniref:SusC/RagA family TonB-linked outer membrane protein n=1 Tax=Flavobacterium hiemivividum TaxID=2541734 RepID=A0A4R5CT14_9FLAO|nr:SusC/RagA family TonB-linked outer membrane protein [Flavobacterium hiemivividum]TDE03769.1 SusC/RagA family TonB-linked outer membrane protein [Flavobacterium hiemivividum]